MKAPQSECLICGARLDYPRSGKDEREEGQDKEHEGTEYDESDAVSSVFGQDPTQGQADTLPHVGDRHEYGVHGGRDGRFNVLHGQGKVDGLGGAIDDTEKDGSCEGQRQPVDNRQADQGGCNSQDGHPEGNFITGSIHDEAAADSTGDTADAPEGGDEPGGAQTDIELGGKRGIDDLIGADDNQEDDEPDSSRTPDAGFFEGTEGVPVEAANLSAGDLFDKEEQGEGQQGEDSQEVEDVGPRGHSDESGDRGGDDDSNGAPADHEALEKALLVLGGEVEGEAVGAGVVEGHAELEEESHADKGPVVLAGIDVGDSDETGELDEQPHDDVGFAMPETEEGEAVAEHAEEDLEHKGDKCDGGEDAHVSHIEAVGEEVEGVQRGEVAEDDALGEVERAEHGEAQDFALL